MLTNSRLVVIFLISAVVFLLTPWVVSEISDSSLSEKPVVLLVGDFSSKEGFGVMVENGVKCAARQGAEIQPRIEYHNISVSEPASEDRLGNKGTALSGSEIQSLRLKLTTEIAKNNVIAIISANTSQTAPVVLEFGRAFNLPVILTVATNDSLLRGFENIAFRMPAHDGKQAEAIRTWCGQQAGRIGLVFDQSRYGAGLRDSLVSEIGPNNLVSFSMSTTTDVAGILKYGKEAGVKVWVVVGYRNQAIEFYSKKVALGVPGPVLFSDGAYGVWLSKLSPLAGGNKVYLSFPLWGRPAASCSGEGSQPSTLKGYSVFGADAHHLLTAAIKKLKAERRDQKNQLAQAIRDVAPGLDFTQLGNQQYQFNSAGENDSAQFSVMEVKNGSTP